MAAAAIAHEGQPSSHISNSHSMIVEGPGMPGKASSDQFDKLNICVSTGGFQPAARRKRRRREDSLLQSLRSWIVNHQIGLSVNLLLLHLLAHICFPPARRRTRSFYQLSYYDETTNTYYRGPEDVYFVLYWVVIFTGMRAAVMYYVLDPFAEMCGVKKEKAKIRFVEQGWSALYYTASFSLGLYIMYHSDYFFALPEMWSSFPTRAIDGLCKWYYLVSFAFWIQQIVVVNMEEWRKDHAQMFTHHIVTLILITMSYGYYQTKVGNVILCIMDFVDILLPAAKMLKYAGWQQTCDAMFALFAVSWFITRHIFFNMVCWSTYSDVLERMPYGCYSSMTGEKLPLASLSITEQDASTTIFRHVMQPFIDPEGPGILLVWFAMIVRVATSFLRGQGADDSRSDEEDEVIDEYEEEIVDVPVRRSSPQPKEEVVGVDGLYLSKRRDTARYRSRRPGNPAANISIAGHPDKKELLGRIGCDKPT